MTTNASNKLLTLLALATLATIHSTQAGSHVWTGGGPDKLWSNAANWTGGAPTAAEAAPVTLIFTNGPVSTNNISGLIADSLVVKADGWVLHGSGGGSLAFRGAGGTNLLVSAVYGGSNTIASTLPLALNGSNIIYIAYANSLNVQSAISGAGGVTLLGSGNLYYSGAQANTYTGKTILLHCLFHLAKTSGVNAIAGPLVVGDNDAALDNEAVYLEASNQISDAAPVTINTNALWYLNGFDETVGPLTLAGGDIDTQGGLLTLSTNVTIENGGVTSIINGRLSLGGVTRSFNFSPSSTLVIGAQISSGPVPAGIVKNGPGEFVLKGPNIYNGATVINGGTLRVQSNTAFGAVAGGLTVATNGSLWLEGVIIGPETLTLGGSIVSTASNYWGGNIILLNDVDINVGSGSKLMLSGAVSGPGQVTKDGQGTLIFSGTLANSYTGATTVSLGRLELNKTNAMAIPGPLLVGDNFNTTNNATVQVMQSNQISDNAPVTVNRSGSLAFDVFNAQSETIGSLAGSGNVNLVLITLTTGGNNANTVFDGVIGGFFSAQLVKAGWGTFTLNGTNTSIGPTTVNAGKLVVNGVLPGDLHMDFLSSLGGTGTVGNVAATLGHLAPGNSVGKITTGNLAISNASSSLDVQINGVTPGVDYDQIVANGAVSLNNPTLNVSLGFMGAVGNQYVLIANDGSDPVSGTFNGLAEGATFNVGPVQFQITYQGGMGSNDVVLTQLSLPLPPKVGGISRMPNGQVQVTGTGIAGSGYDLEANTNLGTSNWIKIGSAQADQSGNLNFNDPDAPNYAMRFYRFKAQ